MKEFFANAAEIIKAASSNPLGIVALAILTVATLAYLLFAKSTDERKTAVFFGTIAFVAFLVIGWALVTKPPTIASSPTIPAEYTRLHDLMAAGRWKEADQENNKLMLKVAGREKEGYLDTDAIKNFSCSALGDIDRLWVQASNGRFGFSVQKQIWKDVGGTPGVYDYDIYKKFRDRVGWDSTFNINAPKGHLPSELVLVAVSVDPDCRPYCRSPVPVFCAAGAINTCRL